MVVRRSRSVWRFFWEEGESFVTPKIALQFCFFGVFRDFWGFFSLGNLRSIFYPWDFTLGVFVVSW